MPIVAPGRATLTSSLDGLLVSGREDHAEAGGDEVERVVLERQLLGVALDEADLQGGRQRRADGQPPAARA